MNSNKEENHNASPMATKEKVMSQRDTKSKKGKVSANRMIQSLMACMDHKNDEFFGSTDSFEALLRALETKCSKESIGEPAPFSEPAMINSPKESHDSSPMGDHHLPEMAMDSGPMDKRSSHLPNYLLKEIVLSRLECYGGESSIENELDSPQNTAVDHSSSRIDRLDCPKKNPSNASLSVSANTEYNLPSSSMPMDPLQGILHGVQLQCDSAQTNEENLSAGNRKSKGLAAARNGQGEAVSNAVVKDSGSRCHTSNTTTSSVGAHWVPGISTLEEEVPPVEGPMLAQMEVEEGSLTAMNGDEEDQFQWGELHPGPSHDSIVPEAPKGNSNVPAMLHNSIQSCETLVTAAEIVQEMTSREFAQKEAQLKEEMRMQIIDEAVQGDVVADSLERDKRSSGCILLLVPSFLILLFIVAMIAGFQ